MPGVVTPARRRREDDDSEEDDFDVSVDGEGSVRSTGSKRARLDEDHESEDGVEVCEVYLKLLYSLLTVCRPQLEIYYQTASAARPKAKALP